jgi:nucleotide-binding universal stress UspA family protein
LKTEKGGKVDEKIVVPLDGSKIGEAALPYVEDLLSKLSPEVKVEVVLLQVLSASPHPVTAGEAAVQVPYTAEEMKQHREKAIKYLNEVSEALRSKGAAVTAKVAVGFPPEEIVRTAEEINANLIAISTHGLSGSSGWAFGGITDKVARRATRIPITIVKAPDYRR